METVNRQCRVLLMMLGRESTMHPDAGEIGRIADLITVLAAFTSTETVEGETYNILDFVRSDEMAVRRLREEVLLRAPPGGAIVRLYGRDTTIPRPILRLLQGTARGITVWGRFVAVRAENLSRDQRRSVLSHELVHAYINSYLGAGSNRLPQWFQEGVAMYLSDTPTVSLSNVGLHMSPEDYREYNAVFRYLDATIGRSGVARFIRRAIEEHSVDGALSAAIGTTSYEELRQRSVRPRLLPDLRGFHLPEGSQALLLILVGAILAALAVKALAQTSGDGIGGRGLRGTRPDPLVKRSEPPSPVDRLQETPRAAEHQTRGLSEEEQAAAMFRAMARYRYHPEAHMSREAELLLQSLRTRVTVPPLVDDPTPAIRALDALSACVSLIVDPAEGRDQATEALAELFKEAKTSNTHIIVERIVDDIDTIVKKVRFPDWQRTSQGECLVQRELRKALLKYQLHRDQDLFDKAYAYIRQYY